MKERIFYSVIDMVWDSEDGKETIILIQDWFLPRTEVVAGDLVEIINDDNESIQVKINQVKINQVKIKPNFCDAGGHNENNVFLLIDKNDSPLLKHDKHPNEYNEIYLLK